MSRRPHAAWAALLCISGVLLTSPARALTSLADQETLRRYASDTWKSLDAMASPAGLPADGLRRNADGTWTAAEFTSPTNIAAYLWSVLAAEDLGLIGPEEAAARIDRTLTALNGLERVHGFFLNWYDSRTGARLTTWPDGRPVRPFLSSVDNGWLAASLIMVRNARPVFRDAADALLGPMNFGFFYAPFDPANPVVHPGLLDVGYWVDEGAYTRNHYGMFNTEPRIASYIGIARGDIPAEHYYRMHRTLPADGRSRTKETTAEPTVYSGVPVVEGSYTYRDLRLVPSWGGSMFEALMVPLFVPEARWGPTSWGINHPLYVRAQMEYGLHDAGYGFWGFSPANRPEGGYGEYGVAAIASLPGGYPSREGIEPANGVVAPYASFLALRYYPAEALANLRALASRFPAIYGPYGFFDSINVGTGQVSDGVLALDQGMILAAIANALKDDVLQGYFSAGSIEAAIRPLMAPERFAAGMITEEVTPNPALRKEEITAERPKAMVE